MENGAYTKIPVWCRLYGLKGNRREMEKLTHQNQQFCICSADVRSQLRLCEQILFKHKLSDSQSVLWSTFEQTILNIKQFCLLE